jgi:hypothetical protein
MSDIGISEIKAAVKSSIEASGPELQNVYTSVFWSDDIEDVYTRLKDDNDNLQRWMIGWNSSPATVRKGGIDEERYTINIFGLFGIRQDNTSSDTFEIYIEKIKKYFTKRESVLACTKHLPPVVIGIENSVYRNSFPIHACQIQIDFIVNNDSDL